MTRESKKVLTSSDITKLGIRSSLVCLTFNYERMMAPGFTYIQIPCLQKIYADNDEELKSALKDNFEFINTHPNFVGFLSGLLLSLEEAGEDRSLIKGVKTALYAPLAGIGDAIFWFTLLPIMAGICSSFAMEGNILGPILFAAVYFALVCLRVPLTHLGYRLGTKSIDTINENAVKLSRAASIVGIMVIGGLIATYVALSLNINFPISSEVTMNLQTELIDKIFPNLLAIIYVAILYFLLKKKNTSPVMLIIGTFVVVLICSYFGIL